MIIPASSAWVEHLVIRNWPRVGRSIAEGEQVMAGPQGRPGRRKRAGAEPSVVRPIRIGDLSAAQIEKEGVNGQTLAVTHDRTLIGILIPVTQGLVQFLSERNISSVLENIRQGGERLKETGPA